MDHDRNDVSITDRLMVLCNRIATRVCKKYPDELFGVIAYINYMRAARAGEGSSQCRAPTGADQPMPGAPDER